MLSGTCECPPNSLLFPAGDSLRCTNENTKYNPMELLCQAIELERFAFALFYRVFEVSCWFGFDSLCVLFVSAPCCVGRASRALGTFTPSRELTQSQVKVVNR